MQQVSATKSGLMLWNFGSQKSEGTKIGDLPYFCPGSFLVRYVEPTSDRVQKTLNNGEDTAPWGLFADDTYGMRVMIDMLE